MTRKGRFYLLGTGVGILTFIPVLIIPIVLNPRPFETVPGAFLFSLILPFFLLAMYTMNLGYVFIILPLLSWEVGWVIGLIFYHVKFSEKQALLKNGILFFIVLIGAIPFLTVQILGVEAIPLMSELINESARSYWYVYPPATFVQIYWGVPLWMITWYYAWTIRIPQDLITTKSLDAIQLQWLSWLIALSGILIINPVLYIIFPFF